MSASVEPIWLSYERHMEKVQESTSSSEVQTRLLNRVLNAGSGSYTARRLHPVFVRGIWKEIRVDIDPQSKPDVIASITDLETAFSPKSFDAIWSSHTLEHLYTHEVPAALAEFRRVLKPNGFALITSPDLEAVVSLMLDHGLDDVAYTSPAGPITPLDMLFGHSASIALGHQYMAHKTGFTEKSLAQRLVDAGFPTVLIKREGFDLWALAFMHEADQAKIQRDLLSVGLDLSE
jgi:SAM-dependent methyltransferase